MSFDPILDQAVIPEVLHYASLEQLADELLRRAEQLMTSAVEASAMAVRHVRHSEGRGADLVQLAHWAGMARAAVESATAAWAGAAGLLPDSDRGQVRVQALLWQAARASNNAIRLYHAAAKKAGRHAA